MRLWICRTDGLRVRRCLLYLLTTYNCSARQSQRSSGGSGLHGREFPHGTGPWPQPIHGQSHVFVLPVNLHRRTVRLGLSTYLTSATVYRSH